MDAKRSAMQQLMTNVMRYYLSWHEAQAKESLCLSLANGKLKTI